MHAEFFYHLHDTILLLGGGTRIAKMVEHFDKLTADDLHMLQQYNLRLGTLAKDRLAHVHTTKVRRRR